jgi:hypothetical protein
VNLEGFERNSRICLERQKNQINKDSWLPEQEKILKKPNKCEAGVLNTQFCCCVSLSSSFEEKGSLILHQFPF